MSCRRSHRLAALTVLIGVLTACEASSESSSLALPKALREVSGLAVLPGGALLAHADEVGVVYQIDFSARQSQPYAQFGDPAARADFEGVALAGERLFLMTSAGDLYEQQVGSVNRSFRIHKTGLKSRCEFEGLVAQPEFDRLALLCKRPYKKKRRGALTLYFYSLKEDVLIESATLRIAKSELRGALHPSAIEWLPATSQFLILLAKERQALLISDSGDVVDRFALPDSALHPQAEGVAVAGKTVFVADEAGGGNRFGVVHRYPLSKFAPAAAAAVPVSAP